MSTSNPQLPTIDISPYLSSGSSPELRQKCAQHINGACINSGFFYLIGHGISPTTADEILDLARKFFLESSEAEKSKIQRLDPPNGDGARGYQKTGENVTKGRRDWHEAVDLYAEIEEAGGPPYKLLRGKNLWPEEPAHLKSAYVAYKDQVKQVATAVVRAMGDALGLDSAIRDQGSDVFANATKRSFWVMRMIGYPGLPGTNGAVELNGDAEQFSCGEHTDYGCITLLLADTTPNALQVQTKSGDWITANPLPGAFIVNIGDMMERWTNGLWRSTNHRVIHRGSSFRVSVPFFFEPNFDAIVRPLDKCVEQTGGKALFDAVVYGEHLIKKVESNFY